MYIRPFYERYSLLFGVVPKWSKGAVCKTVIHRFESDRRLIGARVVEFGRHKGLKIPRPLGRAGSSPAPGTIFRLYY